ncbi:MAG: PilZ domain-containing protein [Elusimicrobiota bacterium]|jgi:hypothetical protein
MLTDQRYHPRVSVFFGGSLYKSPQGEKIGRAIIRDMSQSGMRIESIDPLEKDQTVYVDFEVAGRFDFKKVPALVTRSFKRQSGYLVGLTFLDGHHKRRVRQALSFVLDDGG